MSGRVSDARQDRTLVDGSSLHFSGDLTPAHPWDLDTWTPYTFDNPGASISGEYISRPKNNGWGLSLRYALLDGALLSCRGPPRFVILPIAAARSPTAAQHSFYKRSTPHDGPTRREQPASRTCGERLAAQMKRARRKPPAARKRRTGDRELDGSTASNSQAPAADMATGKNSYPDIMRVRRPAELDRLPRGPEKAYSGAVAPSNRKSAVVDQTVPQGISPRIPACALRTLDKESALTTAMQDLFELTESSGGNAEWVERVIRQSQTTFEAYLQGSRFRDLNELALEARRFRYSGNTGVSSPTSSNSGTSAALHVERERGVPKQKTRSRSFSFERQAAEIEPQFNRRVGNTERCHERKLGQSSIHTRRKARRAIKFETGLKKGTATTLLSLQQRQPPGSPMPRTAEPWFSTVGKRAKPPITKPIVGRTFNALLDTGASA
ncbi:hypothetical protein HPB47_021905 [Ixodes persulcatus]|uniref:Uncharacterized protein n=1 Tax=Ixodes persulcatus TaxID=34615 RepID=A0AC60QB98_IXOPE|nr:hypothetical protein HPB47_021905 [Ixodes persulcatus]